MPTRILRDGILTSDRVNSLSTNAELFYRRLMSVVDDYGRFSADPKLLRAYCYPLKLDGVKEDSISKHLTECADARLIVLYTVSGKAFLEMADFQQRVQTKAKFPGRSENPPESTVDHRELRKYTAIDVVVVEDVVEDGCTPPTKPEKPGTKRRMPADFGISERVKTWAAEKGHGRLEQRLEHFKSAAIAKGYAYAEWDDAFMNAIRGDWARLGADLPAQPRKRRELGT